MALYKGKKWIRRFLRSSTQKRYTLLQPWVTGTTVLDIGSAEGWLGEMAAKEGKRVQLVDLVDLNQTSLPHCIYNGTQLPFPDKFYDTVWILLTLHHCEHPEIVLREAARVAKHRLLITESVFRRDWGRKLLYLLDSGWNRCRSKGRMAPGLHFKRVEEWEALFESEGLHIIHQSECIRGVHRQHFFVLETTK